MYRIEYVETCPYTNRGDVLINGLTVGTGPAEKCKELIEELKTDPDYPRKTECVYDIWLDTLAEEGKACRLSL